MEYRKDFVEQILGEIFGIIVVGAAVCERFINGINASSIAGYVKDAFRTVPIVCCSVFSIIA